MAVALPVAKVEDEPDQEPDEQSHPVRPAEAVDHRAADHDPEDRDNRQRRHPKSAGEVRTSNPQNPDAGANQHEGEERSDAGHLTDDILRNEGRKNAREDKEQPVRFVGRPEARVDLGKNLRHKAVLAHGIENARLTEQHDQNHRGKAGQNCDRHGLREPFVAGHVFGDGESHRRFTAVSSKILHGRDAAEHVREQHVENGAENQRPKNPDRHVALRILRFLCGGRDGIEADVSKEDDARGAENAEDSAIGVLDTLRRCVGGRRRNQRRVIRGIHESPADSDDEQHDAHLQDNDESIHERRFLGAADQQQREQQQDEDSRDIHDPVDASSEGRFEGRMRPLVWYSEAEPLEHAIEVFAPSDRHRGRADRIFEDQIPADDPRDEFTHRRVGIGIGAAGYWNQGSEFRVTKPGKGAADAGDDEGEHDRRTRAIGDRGRGSHKKTGADDRANAERQEVHRPERTLQAVFAHFLRFSHQFIERLSCE